MKVLTNIKKPTLPYQLPGGQTVILLPASKALIDKMQNTKDGQQNAGTAMLYTIAADILSCNAEKQIFTVDSLNDFDIYDVWKLFTDYKNFIMEITKSPN